MKTKILKLSSILLAFISLFLLSITSEAASTHYDIATYFTFSSNMDIDEGFDLIKPFILYYDDNPSTADYTFNYELVSGNQYRFSGTYPDGSNYSIYTTIRIKDNASGTYIEALKTEPYRQSIYIKNLNEGKSTNDCLMECWKNRFVCIKDPTYNIQDTPTMNIYTHMTTIENAAGTHQMQYYAVIENVNYTPDEDPSDNATNNNTTPGGSGSTTNPDDSGNTNQPTDDPSLDEPIIPDYGDTEDDPTPPLDDNDNNEQPNNPNDDNQQPQNPTDNNDKNDDTNKIKTILIVTGSIVGIGLIYLLYMVIRAVIVWLKR